MTGRQYLEDIRTELQSGRHQHRMGENVLRAFGYVRRRATAIQEINETMEDLGMMADPLISVDMPLKAPRIRFRLKHVEGSATPESNNAPEPVGSDDFDALQTDEEIQSEKDSESSLPEPAFRVSELESEVEPIIWTGSRAS